jgi:hypothetical protein
MLAFIPAVAKVRPIGDHVFVEPLPHEKTILLDTWKPTRGIIRAIGKGCNPIKYDGPKGKRTKSWYAKYFKPMDAKVGDVVDLGGRELGGYLFPRVWWGDKEMVVCHEGDIALVRE